ncbi:MAG: 2-oxoacid:acceptor oxidoreductase subunit alpha [Anaerolineae bacterium]|nr:MAG: 2-oxoacid:acceptor oxidoreductase subunit alpha [Anaerolineae bacterium]
MTTASPKTRKATAAANGRPKEIVNDFSMTVATKNGSGSQTSNVTLLRAMFRMGIPVSGKNLFPSNIQGLPTWYTIRASKDGYTARRETHEVVVAMNGDTFVDDFRKVVPGGAFYYADDLKFAMDRKDIAIYPVPAKKLAKESGAPAALRDYVANMAYVGVVAQMMDIDMDKIRAALDFHFSGREKPIALNMGVIEAAAQFARETLTKNDPYVVRPMNKTGGLIMADGNTAAALGAIYGGVQFLSWYPITPASSLAEGVSAYISDLRDDPAKPEERTYAIVQAEDELAAAGMAVGAGWGGLRAMTSTSGPGISLMTEFTGLAYYAEVPIVIWDVQRMGPSTGLPTRTSQGDISMVHSLGHGDTENIILLPGSATECFEFGWKAFDIAERLQTPVFVLSDLDLGMNQWMTKPFEYPDVEMDRGKVLWEKDLDKWVHDKPWGRYLDVDKDGITYRTLPGNKHPRSAYFARGTGHDEYGRYTERGDDWERNMARLAKKFKTAVKFLPKPEVKRAKDAKVGILSFGSTDAAILEGRDRLLQGRRPLKTNYLRLRAIPFSREVRKFIEDNKYVYVVEMNRDGQLHQLLTVAYPDLAKKLISVAKNDGLPLSARFVDESIRGEEK